MSPNLVRKIGAAYEICGGRAPSEGAKREVVRQLEHYPERSVSEALDRCMSEVSGFLKLADIIARIDDGHPDPNEAWALVPKNDADSTVWTAEIAAAYGVVSQEVHKRVEPRMAFLEAYRTELAKARAARRAPNWHLSPGEDPRGRERAVLVAVEKRRLTPAEATRIVPSLPAADLEKVTRALPPMPERPTRALPAHESKQERARQEYEKDREASIAAAPTVETDEDAPKRFRHLVDKIGKDV